MCVLRKSSDDVESGLSIEVNKVFAAEIIAVLSICNPLIDGLGITVFTELISVENKEKLDTGFKELIIPPREVVSAYVDVGVGWTYVVNSSVSFILITLEIMLLDSENMTDIEGIEEDVLVITELLNVASMGEVGAIEFLLSKVAVSKISGDVSMLFKG